MINEKKVRLMTKLALYEQNNGKEEIPMSRYYKSDYMALKLINSTIVVSFGYIVLLATILLMDIENTLRRISGIDFLKLGINLLAVYVFIILFNLIVSGIIYSKRFKNTREGLKNYNADLKELYLTYKEDDIMETGGIDDDETAGY